MVLVHLEPLASSVYLVRSWSAEGEWGDVYDGIGVIVVNGDEAEGKGFLGEWPIRNTLALRKELKKTGVGVFRCQIKGTNCEWRWKNRKQSESVAEL